MKRPTFTDQSRAHKGYIIRPAGIASGNWFIEKDGFHIAYASSIEDAKRTIDLIAGG